MKRNRLFLTIVFILSLTNAYAHKDRIERAQTFRFIFQNNDTVSFNNSGDAALKLIVEDILNHKKQLREAQLTFKTGEVLTFKYDFFKLTSITIIDKKKEKSVPKETLDKISEIHFHTIALLWNGSHKNAFGANYMYIRFEMGTEKLAGEFAHVNVFFSDKK